MKKERKEKRNNPNRRDQEISLNFSRSQNRKKKQLYYYQDIIHTYNLIPIYLYIYNNNNCFILDSERRVLLNFNFIIKK